MSTGVEKWDLEEKWDIEFFVDKCKVNTSTGKLLQEVQEEKDLWVIISIDLESPPSPAAAQTANSVLGLSGQKLSLQHVRNHTGPLELPSHAT